MWVLKRVLLGPAIFFVGVLAYTVIGMGIAMYRLRHQFVKLGGIAGGNAEIRENIHNPILWIVLFTAIAIGLWLMSGRTTRMGFAAGMFSCRVDYAEAFQARPRPAC